ncbi:hypothetical protein [Shewanella colwelliana]|uniref:hypothetical protein n=1 Tax=Shewanella colwelliana TaxID=23 RepID=UPI0012DF629B|nr:hypothetical protein [Shewanella colwelliana]
MALIISAYATSGEWTFSGSNEASTAQSVSDFIKDENGVSHIPSYVIVAKIDAFECDNPYLKLCVKQELDILNYSCLGTTLDGLNRKEIELKGSNIPEFNCSEKAWYNK